MADGDIWLDKDGEEWKELGGDLRHVTSGDEADWLSFTYVEEEWGPLVLQDAPVSYILVVSDGWYTRAEGPMYEHQAMTRRAELWDSVSGVAGGLRIEMIVAGRWDG